MLCPNTKRFSGNTDPVQFWARGSFPKGIEWCLGRHCMTKNRWNVDKKWFKICFFFLLFSYFPWLNGKNCAVAALIFIFDFRTFCIKNLNGLVILSKVFADLKNLQWKIDFSNFVLDNFPALTESNTNHRLKQSFFRVYFFFLKFCVCSSHQENVQIVILFLLSNSENKSQKISQFL